MVCSLFIERTFCHFVLRMISLHLHWVRSLGERCYIQKVKLLNCLSESHPGRFMQVTPAAAAFTPLRLNLLVIMSMKPQ